MAMRKMLTNKEKALIFFMLVVVGLTVVSMVTYASEFFALAKSNLADKQVVDAVVAEMKTAVENATHVELVSLEDARTYENQIYLYRGDVYLNNKKLYDHSAYSDRKMRMIMRAEYNTFYVSVQLLDDNNRVSYTQDTELRINGIKILHREIEGRINEDLVRPVISFTNELG